MWKINYKSSFISIRIIGRIHAVTYFLLNKEENITSNWEIITNTSKFSKILDPGSIVLAQLTRDAPNILGGVD